jgi:hypothetical protein
MFVTFQFSVVQESRSCTVTVTGEQQYIARSLSTSSDFNSLSSCGTRTNPWRLEAPAGQRINISLLDFTGSVGAAAREGHGAMCRTYGYLVEKSNKKNVSICGATSIDGTKLQRESAVYMSEVNSVDIVLVTGVSVNNSNFLLRINGTFDASWAFNLNVFNSPLSLVLMITDSHVPACSLLRIFIQAASNCICFLLLTAEDLLLLVVMNF